VDPAVADPFPIRLSDYSLRGPNRSKPVLICRPVSRRSSPQKIRNWIHELEQLREHRVEDAEARALIDRCIEHASHWLGSRAA
jgi:hypothetical protein